MIADTPKSQLRCLHGAGWEAKKNDPVAAAAARDASTVHCCVGNVRRKSFRTAYVTPLIKKPDATYVKL